MNSLSYGLGITDFNQDKIRNRRNTKAHNYNCGGHALNTYSWYLPCNSPKVCGYLGEMSNDNCSKAMLNDFPDLRIIKDLSDVKDNEYAIAFRLSSSDFHFIRQEKNGLWTHKRGLLPKIETVTEDFVFSYSWFEKYDGGILLFAKIRES